MIPLPELSRRRRTLVLVICCLSLFIVGLDTTVVNVALPAIGRDLRASVAGLQWTIDAYTLVLASLLMLSGSTADRLGRPGRVSAWADLLGRAAGLAPVLVHGDIHEDQLLADGGRLTGVIDWETARVDHPFWDFDLGEWGTGLWRRRRRDFSALWARGWLAYARRRGLDADSRPLETAFRLRHALRLLADPGDPAVVGTLEEHLAGL